MLKDYLDLYAALFKIVWKNIFLVLLYVISMWGLLVVAVFLLLEDLLKSAGIVSAVILFQIVHAEFNREFFGIRNPEVQSDAVQKQSKR